MTEIKYYGHSCVQIKNNDTTILIDPFFSGNTSSPVQDPDEVSADYIVVTHAHGDHIGDAVEISKNTGAVILSNFEIYNHLEKFNVNAIPYYIGGKKTLNSGFIKFFPAAHGSSFADGSYGGLAMSVVVSLDGKKIFHAGDTGLTIEFKAIAELYDIDVALLPIGGTFTMDISDAAIAANWLGTKKVIPIHFNTWDIISVDETQIEKMFSKDISVDVIKPGGSIVLSD